MKKFFALAMLAVAVLVAGTATLKPSEAEAGPVFKAFLVSDAGGATQTVQISSQQIYCLQPDYSTTCYALGVWDGGAAGVLPNCTHHDPICPQPTASSTLTGMYPMCCFESGGKTALAVGNQDGGPATSVLFTLEKNKSADLAPHMP